MGPPDQSSRPLRPCPRAIVHVVGVDGQGGKEELQSSAMETHDAHRSEIESAHGVRRRVDALVSHSPSIPPFSAEGRQGKFPRRDKWSINPGFAANGSWRSWRSTVGYTESVFNLPAPRAQIRAHSCVACFLFVFCFPRYRFVVTSLHSESGRKLFSVEAIRRYTNAQI